MLRKRIFKTTLMMLLCMLLFSVMPIKAFADRYKTASGHIIFSEKEINNRIAKIRDYYYNKPEKLVKKSAEFYDFMREGDAINFDYYLNGKDLMFAYGIEPKEKTEYRIYFYKNQMIQILIDKKGEKRLNHTQFYVKFDTNFYDENLNYYLNMENFFKIKLSELSKKTPRTKTDGYIFITDISKKSITYHFGTGYGSDGVMVSLDDKAYTAKLSKKVKVKDYTENPDKYKLRSLEWLFGYFKEYYMNCAITAKNGKIVEIELPYQP